MKKILIISNTSFSIEKFRSHYLNKLSSKYHIKVLTPSKRPLNLFKRIYFKKLKNLNLINFFFKLKKELNFFRPNKIIIYSWKYQFYMCLLNFLNKNVEVIHVIAGGGSLFIKKNKFLIFFLFKIVKYILKKPNKIIFINPYDKIWFEKNFRIFGKTYLIPTEGVELIKKKNKINKRKNFLFFARLIKEKGVFEFLELANILKKKDKNLNFFIAGPANQSLVGESRVPSNILNRIKSNPNVSYLGNIKSFKNIFYKIDCLVSPSYTEGAGTSVMEAMMSGLYVVAYKNNGHNFVLKNTKNYLCKNNNVTQLLKGIEQFLKMKNDDLEKNTLNSFNKINNTFSSEIVYKKIKKIISTEI
jgi:glycosyltransferase involved in cell wall biosynthesis